MDKVDISALSPSFYPGQKPETKKTRANSELPRSRKSQFSEILEELSPAEQFGPVRDISPSQEALAQLMDAVHSAGSDLRDRPFHEEMLKYKKAVREFVHYVVKNSYELERTQGVKKRIVSQDGAEWRAKEFFQVKVVDKKLEELAAAILSGQSTQLERVSKINEISGLLVDLTISGVIKERDD